MQGGDAILQRDGHMLVKNQRIGGGGMLLSFLSPAFSTTSARLVASYPRSQNKTRAVSSSRSRVGDCGLKLEFPLDRKRVNWLANQPITKNNRIR